MSIILVISAHPDDETIGAGGTLFRHISRGDQVHWCIVTRPHKPTWSDSDIDIANRQIEAVAAAYHMTSVHRLGFPTVQLNTVPYNELGKAIQNTVDVVKPDIVYLPPGNDLNADHRIVYESGLVATRPLSPCTVRKVMAYEISTTTRYWSKPFVPNVYVDISAYLKKKIDTLMLYEAEIKGWPHPRSPEGMRILSRERGLAIGVDAAECFELIRSVVL